MKALLLLVASVAPGEPVPGLRYPSTPKKAEAVKAPEDTWRVVEPTSELPQFPPSTVIRRKIAWAERYRDSVAFLAQCGLIDRGYYACAAEANRRASIYQMVLEKRAIRYHFDHQLGDHLQSVLGEDAYKKGILPILP